MNDLATRIASPLPSPRCAVTVRPATLDDLPFIDSLQKLHKRQVGFMYTGTLEGKIRAGDVLIAEQRDAETERHGDEVEDGASAHSVAPSLRLSVSARLGYCIGTDRYFKRDDTGIIYHLNVVPGKQRSLIGATLVKAMFDRAAYGCRLFCCWCAQDIDANRFWESLGFIPLAFRAGSRAKDRVHIFWQRRIREGDTNTPYWFPSQTTGGSIGEDRIVFPIPPGMHWQDEMPRILPGAERIKLEAPKSKRASNSKIKIPNAAPVPASLGRLSFAPPVAPKPAKPAREKRPKLKNDPALVAKARELKDKWLECVNADPSLLLSNGKYEVTKSLPAPAAEVIASTPALPNHLAA
jgi:hypothetical protein